jgi:hypothetical protein
MKGVDGVIISSIHRITGNEYFKQLFLRQSQNCFSTRSAKEPSTQKSRLWDFLPKMGRFSPLQGNKAFLEKVRKSDKYQKSEFSSSSSAED